MPQPPAFVDFLVDTLVPTYAEPFVEPVEPEQTYLLGHRFADYGLCLVVAFLLPVLRSLLRTYVYTPLGVYCMFTARGVPVPNFATHAGAKERMRKWNESLWKMTVYICFSTLAFLISYKERWFYDTRYFWVGCTHFPPCNLYVSNWLLLFYCVQTGFYLQAIHFLAFHEIRRKDWLESMIHHVVTVGLMAYSYYCNFTRIGILIMLLHDISDIFLEAAKLARYCRQALLAVILFTLFFVSWVLLRMVYFPLFIMRSTLSEPIAFAARKYNIDPMPHYVIFNGLLLVLLVLHTYWSYLILLVLIKAVEKKGDSGDVREDDDGQEDKED